MPQPNHHWGDGLEQDVLTFANFRMPLNEAGTSRDLQPSAATATATAPATVTAATPTTPATGPRSIRWASFPTFNGERDRLLGGRRAARRGLGLELRSRAPSSGTTTSTTTSRNTLNASLGPCLDVALRPGRRRHPGHRRRSRASPTRPSSSPAGCCARSSSRRSTWPGRSSSACPQPVNLAFGAAFRRESYAIRAGELASYVNGFHLDQDSAGRARRPARRSFPASRPDDATERDRTNFGLYADAETDLTSKLLANVAARFETYSDFGERVTGKVALRYQPSRRVTFRAAASTGFRAPGLSQVVLQQGDHQRDRRTEFIEVGIFPVDHPAALALGSRPLKEETSFNFSGGLAVTPVDNFTITADYFHIRSTTGSCSAPPSTTTPRVATPGRRGVHRHRRGAVLHQRPRHPDPGRGHHRPTPGPGRRQRDARPQRLGQLHPERDHAGGSAAPGAAGRRLDRAGAARLGRP